jgi:hypothetical protein
MKDTYTIALDVNGGTYIDQRSGSTPKDALRIWAQNPHPTVLSAFNLSNSDEFHRAVEVGTACSSESIVPLSGLQSVWFFSIQVNEINGFLNLIRTKID